MGQYKLSWDVRDGNSTGELEEALSGASEILLLFLEGSSELGKVEPVKSVVEESV